ncbi:hypothetical protein [Corynebacterium ulceribovis]|uniref:hypothetical protein n=1 Tax=Corynebacterium ulceribovis TaxID=487732 RepID=UPI0003783148|nr:hypothetical protein [Corynebacterium ulceribovis]
MRQLKTLTAVCAATLFLAGCGSDPEPPAAVTVTTTVPADDDDSIESVDGPASDEAAAKPTQAAKPKTYIPAPEHQGQVGGKCGYIEGSIEVNAASRTSCDFAYAMFSAAAQQTYATQFSDLSPNVPAPFAEGMQVDSPVTGETYTVDCSFGVNTTTSMFCAERGNLAAGVSADFKITDPANYSWPDTMTVN